MILKTDKDVSAIDRSLDVGTISQSLTDALKELPSGHPVIRLYLLKLCDLLNIEYNYDESSKMNRDLTAFLKENENRILL